MKLYKINEFAPTSHPKISTPHKRNPKPSKTHDRGTQNKTQDKSKRCKTTHQRKRDKSQNSLKRESTTKVF